MTTRLTITADMLLTPHDSEMRVFGTVQSLAQMRHKGTGLPWSKVGNKVIYRGSDILAALEAGASK